MQAIAHFIPTMHGGGAERVVINLLEGKTAHNLPLELVLASAEGPYLDKIPDSVRLIDLKAGRVFTSILPLVKYLRTHKPKVLISHMGHANVIALIANYLSGTNTPIIVVEHNTFSAATPKNRRAKLVAPMMKWLYPYADSVVTVSQAAAHDLEQGLGLPANSVQTIYNPIVSDRLTVQAQQKPDHPWLQPNSPPVAIAVGRLTEQKDFTTLIKAFAVVRQSQDARLIILGEGELRPQLEALIKELNLTDTVALPGFVTNPYAYLKAAQAFILSSRWEGLPTVLVEAMACGTPVIATDCPSGPREILAGGKYGSLVPVGDDCALAEAIKQIFTQSLTAETLQKRSQEFSIENSVAQYLQLIDKICI